MSCMYSTNNRPSQQRSSSSICLSKKTDIFYGQKKYEKFLQIKMNNPFILYIQKEKHNDNNFTSNYSTTINSVWIINNKQNLLH